jgi:phosphoglycolate phosphatase-like HAD superfamily hydrolase
MAAMQRTVFVFDLDGTLVDSVYQHVLAWQEAMEAAGIELSVWRIHRRMGMSGGLFVGALLREIGRPVDAELVGRLQQAHAEAYRRRAGQVRLLPGARELLAHLTGVGVPWAVATSGLQTAAQPTLELLEVPASVPVVTRDQVGVDRLAGLAQQRPHEQPAAHAHAPVDPPHRQLDPAGRQRLLPGQHVLVDAVDQGAVEVEQEDGPSHAGSRRGEDRMTRHLGRPPRTPSTGTSGSL